MGTFGKQPIGEHGGMGSPSRVSDHGMEAVKNNTATARYSFAVFFTGNAPLAAGCGQIKA